MASCMGRATILPWGLGGGCRLVGACWWGCLSAGGLTLMSKRSAFAATVQEKREGKRERATHLVGARHQPPALQPRQRVVHLEVDARVEVLHQKLLADVVEVVLLSLVDFVLGGRSFAVS
jgi:hypothetical protein